MSSAKPLNPLSFEFHDGTKTRRVDGIRLSLRFQSKIDERMMDALRAMDSKAMPVKANETDEQRKQRESVDMLMRRTAAEAALQITDVARDIFELEPYAYDDKTETESGLIETQVLDVFYAFMEWQTDEKKNQDIKPSSQPSTVRPSSKGRRRNS